MTTEITLCPHGEIDKGKFIRVRCKYQKCVYLYWSPRTNSKKFYLKFFYFLEDIFVV